VSLAKVKKYKPKNVWVIDKSGKAVTYPVKFVDGMDTYLKVIKPFVSDYLALIVDDKYICEFDCNRRKFYNDKYLCLGVIKKDDFGL
jgi:hypothetical protein